MEPQNNRSFYCERIKAQVDSKSCPDCTEVDNCKEEEGCQNRYYNEERKLNSFRTKLYRALTFKNLKEEKGKAYNWRITGVVEPLINIPFANEYCIKCVKKEDLFKILGVHENDDLVSKMSRIAEYHLYNKKLWNDKPAYHDSVKQLSTIIKISKKLTDCFDGLDRQIQSLLRKECESLINVRRLSYAADEIKKDLLFHDSQLLNYPFFLCSQQLSAFYQDVTTNPATISYTPESSSPFLEFAYKYFLCVDPEVIYPT